MGILSWPLGMSPLNPVGEALQWRPAERCRCRATEWIAREMMKSTLWRQNMSINTISRYVAVYSEYPCAGQSVGDLQLDTA